MDANMAEKDACTRRTVRGLTNLGNTCFFNSVMQNLLAVAELRDHFMKPAQFPEGPLTSALRKLYVETSSEGSAQGDDIDVEVAWWNREDKAINPNVLFSAISAKNPQFMGFDQQDSHELLRCLLDNLHTEELQSLSNSKPMNCGDGEASEGINIAESSNQRNNATLVDRVFQGQLCSTICCSKCGYHSVTYEPFHDLSLPIPSKLEPMKLSSRLDFFDSLKRFWGLLGGSDTDDDIPSFFSDDESSAVQGKAIEDGESQSRNLFSNDESSAVQGKAIEDGESDTLLYGEIDVHNLLNGLSVTIETKEEEREAAVITNPDTDDDDIWNTFSDNVSSSVQRKTIEAGESKSLLYGETIGDNLFKGVPVATETREEDREVTAIPMSIDGCLVATETREEDRDATAIPMSIDGCLVATETREEDRDATANPMSIDGCLVEFTKPEILTGENGWKCSNCASMLVNDSDQNTTAKEEQDMGINGKLNIPVYDSESPQGVSCSHGEHGEGHSNKNETVFRAEDSSEIDGTSQAERPPSEHEADSDAIIQETTKRYLISKALPILTIHLKRFQQTLNGSLSKLSGHVAFHEMLDLTPYLDPRCRNKDNCTYRLIGVVEHSGNMEMGHYVAYVRCDQEWFYVSDSHVKRVSFKQVLKSQAYILFYEKCKL